MATRRKSSPSIWIGTSGWHYRHWIGPFYPSGLSSSRFLEHYAKTFNTVEVNNAFYHLLSKDAIRDWLRTVPPGFLFTAKGSRFITHMKKLKDPKPALARYFERMDVFGRRLGPVVFQLPPFWRFNPERLRGFLEALPGKRRFAFELREPSWLTGEAYDLLAKYNAALCLYDIAGFRSPIVRTADFIYIRLHGPGAKYQGSYSDETLADWAKRLLRWQAEGCDTYCFFDNDQAAYAVGNAIRLRELINEVGNSKSQIPNSKQTKKPQTQKQFIR